jgi:putative hydrolase of HD superfamily
MRALSHSSKRLFEAAGRLKKIERSGWVKKVGIENAESVADHTFRMALIAAYISTIETGLDTSKLLRMCLLHDIAESQTGDLMPEEKTHLEKDKRPNEDKIMHEILGTLPDPPRRVFLSDWKELIKGKTREARLVWDIDNLEMQMQAIDYERDGYDAGKLLEFRKKRFHKSTIQTQILNEYERDSNARSTMNKI